MFALTADLIPLYALYALLFADHGLSIAQISSLLAIWSTTSFVLEVPSGAWADTVSRRGLLVLSGVLLFAGFTAWTVFPSYAGFALGFVLWGTSGALRSGTFEALIYDELAAHRATGSYVRIMGRARAAAEIAALLGILAAAPLFAWGGYALVGWASVVVALVHTLTALTLPSAPKAVSAADVDDLDDADLEELPPRHSGALLAGIHSDGSSADCVDPGQKHAGMTGWRYVHMLRSGLREALRVRLIRRGLILAALLNGITAYDEYFALLAGDAGVSPWVAAILVGVTVAGAAAGALLADRTDGMRPRTMALALAVGGFLFIGGALLSGLAAQHPHAVYVLTAVGFTAIGIAYGIDYNAETIAGARLQDAIEGPARATVTSVSGLLTEVIAFAVFGFVALASLWISIPVMVALLGVPFLLTAALFPAWLPARKEEAPTPLTAG
ncbi:MFS transporter [Nocardia huaxiensis]|uniref:MFS transporter n=1 Tax=Nocardia huaxiensis TaxID=2755382 RepID=A0A7D7A230_9NOCA|nr:MFS transporter [Nocardia huaxiensis]QLY34049.1 MFS transporter [Nocardia huaxiensis]